MANTKVNPFDYLSLADLLRAARGMLRGYCDVHGFMSDQERWWFEAVAKHIGPEPNSDGSVS